MRELLPTLQADDIRRGLVDFLVTTFALADPDARAALEQFLTARESGVFKGPYVRVRVPFRAAHPGWRRSLDWYDEHGYTPYGHQAAAFARLSTAGGGTPQPTVVTTGTGSGKTEAFLYPILDHVLRAKREGQGGVKALILYPMNALANDQARRLAQLITSNARELGGVRAAIYTGQKEQKRTSVTEAGLINERSAIRAEAPDILLTNYKMLDQLLLRSADQPLWQQSANSLRYLVLDEFHTYDGAQGTDVAMLLRRLGLTLARYGGAPSAMIPVATSATLGDQNDPSRIIDFANTVFGNRFDETCVVTETRQTIDEWSDGALERIAARGLRPRALSTSVAERIVDAVDRLGRERRDAQLVTGVVLAHLYQTADGNDAVVDFADLELLADLTKAHPLVHRLTETARDAVSLDDLADALLPGGLGATETYESRRAVRVQLVVALLAAYSHVRYRVGRPALSIDLHLWIRALSRIDRSATPQIAFSWSDDGQAAAVDEQSIPDPTFPAIYCRHCGRSGWAVELAPAGSTLASDDRAIRANHASRANSRFRALIHAPEEALRAQHPEPGEDGAVEGLRWLDVQERQLVGQSVDHRAPMRDAVRLPVLTLVGDDIGDRSNRDECPSCQRTDGIRFLGSAVATMLSVAITTIFADRALDTAEKKALVFTDSVQDAAHRAGFVQSRSHVFSLRNAIRAAVSDRTLSLDLLVEELIRRAVTPSERFRLLSPEIVEREEFRAFWERERVADIPVRVRRRVADRLLLDVELEFGLQSRVGRTLELTGTLAAEVDAGSAARLASIAQGAIRGFGRQAELDGVNVVSDAQLTQWVRGVLERMRDRGAIEHKWFKRYLENDGRRWTVWGGRPRGVGMPAFPRGRDAPGYPRVGPNPPTGSDSKRTHLDVATSAQSWFAVWAKQVLGVTAQDGAKLTRALLAELEQVGVLTSVSINSSVTAYQISPSLVTVTAVGGTDREEQRHLLICDICRNPVPGTPDTVAQLDGAPCFATRCPGRQRRARATGDYYRRLYDEGDMRTVVAREHTGLLDDELRLAYENGFKSSTASTPDNPNVLVATPTLEMGIDIGDLSTVMLAGLPRSVASYLQRIGRAGRLTGNALSLAFVEGRGAQLPKVGDPLSVINGAVRAPATYLNAEEILRRQYLAYLCDCQAKDTDKPPREARDVLRSAEGDSYLALVVRDAEEHHEERLDEFLGAFESLDANVVDTLRLWALPGTVPGESGLADTVYRAVQRWNNDEQLLKHRRTAVEEALPVLKQEAERPANKDDEEVKAQLRAAESALKFFGKMLAAHRSEPWIGALERFGVLPNYTLLDESVQLDVSLSWYDEESNAWAQGSESFERGAAIAIHELAPGAMFYAQGLEMRIDAVDLGVDGGDVQRWAQCPSCGYGQQLFTGDKAPSQCQRCHETRIADAAQQFDVLEMARVYAEVRRDEASIGDGRDERQRERFTVQVAADVDPAHVDKDRQWHLPGSGFGVTYLRSMRIRWLNTGNRAQNLPAREIAGSEIPAPLFRVCEACGKLDSTASANSAQEHRSWCRYRTAKDEHVRTIALSRTLQTQGLVLRLPASVRMTDVIAVSSFSAAIRLGLREQLGGDPDHLRIERIVDPVAGAEDNQPALLLHDAVPGGTGYLAELADWPNIKALLESALAIVESCPCQTEARGACHRCLLPFAPSGNADAVSRISAVHTLTSLLDHPWQTKPGPAEVLDPPLEAMFREVFIARAKKLGATVKEIPGATGTRVHVTLGKRTWLLRPQVPLGPTTPDFVLEAFGGGVDPIAIYTDGFAFHASKQHNNVRVDAEKRDAVRAKGYQVLALTYDQVLRAAADEPEPPRPWFDHTFASNFTALFGLALGDLDRIGANPVTELMAWLQNPDQAAVRWREVGRALPTISMSPLGAFATISGSLEEWLRGEFLSGAPLPTAASSDTWVVRHGTLTWVSRFLDKAGTTSETVLMLDDRQEALEQAGFKEAWQQWLAISNLLGARAPGNPVKITSATALLEKSSPSSDNATTGELQKVGAVDLLFTDEQALVVELDHAGVAKPVLGGEFEDGIPIGVAWPDLRVAVDLGLSDTDLADLQAAGWTTVPADVGLIITAIRKAA